jgi:hypothetical protein
MAGASALLHVDKYAGDMEAFGGGPKKTGTSAGVPVRHRPVPAFLPEGQQADINAAAKRGIGGTIPFSEPPSKRAGMIPSTGSSANKGFAKPWLSAADVVVSRRSKRTSPGVAAAAAVAAGDGMVDSHSTVIGEGHRAGRSSQGRVAGDLRGFVTPRSMAGNEMLQLGSASGVGRSLRARGTGSTGKSLLHVHRQAEKLLHHHAHSAAKRSNPQAGAAHGGQDGVMDDITASELSKYGMITLQDQMNSRMVPSKQKGGKSVSSQRQATQEAIQIALSTTAEYVTAKRGGIPSATIGADSEAARAVQLAKVLSGYDTGAGLRGAADDDSDSDDEPLGKHKLASQSTQAGRQAAHAPPADLNGSTCVHSVGLAGTVAPGFASTLGTRSHHGGSAQLNSKAAHRPWATVAPSGAPSSDLTGHKLHVHGVTRPAQLRALSLAGGKERYRCTAGDPNKAIVAGSSAASTAFVQKQPVLSAFDKPTPKPNLTALRRQMQAEFASR